MLHAHLARTTAFIWVTLRDVHDGVEPSGLTHELLQMPTELDVLLRGRSVDGFVGKVDQTQTSDSSTAINISVEHVAD